MKMKDLEKKMDEVDRKKLEKCNKEFFVPDQADHIVVCVSGGKDSACLMEYALRKFPKEKLHFVHAMIDIDWTVTKEVCEQQAEHFGVKMNYVQAISKAGKAIGFLDVLTRSRIDRKTGEAKEYQFPDNSNRWCTSTLKTGPLDKFARKFKGNVLILIGERAEESSKRAKLEMWRPQPKMMTASRNVVKYSPILYYTQSKVWQIINDQNIPKHPCYSWGVSRASCAICIFSSNKEIKIAAEKEPELVRKYVEAEKKISHTFRYRKTKKDGEIKETVEDILNGSDKLPKKNEA